MALTSALPGRGSRGHLRLHPQVNKFLRPGLYTVEDSDPATWSQNAATLGRGFIRVFGNGSGQHMHRAPTRAPSLPANFKPCGNLLPGFRLEMSPCIGPSSTIITLVVVNRALTAPLNSVTFRLEQKSFGAQTNVPPVVTAPVMGSGTAVGSVYEVDSPTQLLKLCLGGQYSMLGVIPYDSNGTGQGEVARFTITGCP